MGVATSRPSADEWHTDSAASVGSLARLWGSARRYCPAKTVPLMAVPIAEPTSRVVSFIVEAAPWLSGPKESMTAVVLVELLRPMPMPARNGPLPKAG